MKMKKFFAYNDYPIVHMREDKILILRDPQRGNNLIYCRPSGEIKGNIHSICICGKF